jgi:surface antigen
VNIADCENVSYSWIGLSPAGRWREENAMTGRIALLLLAPIAVLAAPAVADTSGAYADDDIWILEDCTQECLEGEETDEKTASEDPDAGPSAPVPPAETFRNGDGQYCREYQQTITIGGREQQAHGTVCRMPDGSWKIVRPGEPASAPPPPEPAPIPRARSVLEPL